MKNKILSMSMFLLMAATTVFTGCSKEEEAAPAAPSVSISGVTGSTSTSSGKHNISDAVVISYKATAEAGISSIVTSWANATNTGTVENKTGGFSSSTEHTGNVTFTIPATPASAIYTVKIVVTDKSGNTSTATYTATVGSVAGGAIKTSTAKLLGSYSNSSAGSFYATATETIYLQADAKTNQSAVDFAYFYGATNFATVAAPNDAAVSGASSVYTGASAPSTWTTKNATLFATTTLTAAQFDAVADDAAIVALTAPTASKVNGLAVGSVVSFKTVAGKRGLFKVTSLNTGAAGDMTIVVKVQQ